MIYIYRCAIAHNILFALVLLEIVKRLLAISDRDSFFSRLPLHPAGGKIRFSCSVRSMSRSRDPDGFLAPSPASSARWHGNTKLLLSSSIQEFYICE